MVIRREYIFIYAKGDVVAEQNDVMKNPKEKKESSVIKWRFEEVLLIFFIFKKI